MDSLYGFFKTLLDFLVQIIMLFISMFIFILNFLGDLVQGAANSV